MSLLFSLVFLDGKDYLSGNLVKLYGNCFWCCVCLIVFGGMSSYTCESDVNLMGGEGLPIRDLSRIIVN